MGRALRVSKSFPRIAAAVQKPSAFPSCAASSNGDLQMCSCRCPNTRFSPFFARQGPRIVLGVCENAIGAALARRFCSGTEFSDLEWLETDDDVVHTEVSSPQLAFRHLGRTACDSQPKTGAFNKQGNVCKRTSMPGSHRLPVERERIALDHTLCAAQADTDDEAFSSSPSEDEHRLDTRRTSVSREFEMKAGSCLRSSDSDQAQWSAYTTESETDDGIVGSSSNDVERQHQGRLKSRERQHQGRLKSRDHETDPKKYARQRYIAEAPETDTDTDTLDRKSKEDMLLHNGTEEYESLSDTGSETDTESEEARTRHLMKANEDKALHHGRQRSRLHCLPTKVKSSQIQHAVYETESETDREIGDEKSEYLHGNPCDVRDNAVDGGATRQESDDCKHGEDSESEEKTAGSGISDWEETDEDDEDESAKLWNDIYGSDDDQQSPSAGSSKLSRGLDKLYNKPSSHDRPHVSGRTLEKPSRKERSAGLSPRTIRDDDSDDVEIESDLEGELQEEIERQMAAEPKFERPSITWGILLTRDHRLEARENVIKYLETEGIDTTELKCIELPTKVEVMQTRLGFLRKIGLDNDAINNYPLILGCSVPKNMVPVLKYLKKLGFPQPWVPLLLKKYPMILQASVVIDVLPVIYFLRGLDIDPIDLPRVIMKYPDLLSFKTEGTMSTSVAYLVSMGVNLRHVGYMLTECPEIMGMRVASVLKPKFEYLMSLGIPQIIAAKILARRPHLLGYDLEKRMQCNVDHLVELGVRKEAIPGMVAQFPEILGRVFAHFVKEHVEWLKENLELDSDSVARIIEKMPQVIFMPTAMARERIRFLKSERFTYAEIGSMVTRCPQILVSSIYDSLRPNLNFLTREMKRSRAEVLDFPAFFTYSLQSRIRPRFQALTGENLQCTLDWLLNCSEVEFQKRLKAGDQADEGLAGIEFVMGGPLPKKLAINTARDKSNLHPAELFEVAAL